MSFEPTSEEQAAMPSGSAQVDDLGCISSPHHFGRVVPLAVVLEHLAAGEGFDGSPYDEMQLAAGYIRQLEERLGIRRRR